MIREHIDYLASQARAKKICHAHKYRRRILVLSKYKIYAYSLGANEPIQTSHAPADRDLDHLIPPRHRERLCQICVVQILPRKHMLVDHADCTSPARQHELQ